MSLEVIQGWIERVNKYFKDTSYCKLSWNSSINIFPGMKFEALISHLYPPYRRKISANYQANGIRIRCCPKCFATRLFFFAISIIHIYGGVQFGFFYLTPPTLVPVVWVEVIQLKIVIHHPALLKDTWKNKWIHIQLHIWINPDFNQLWKVHGLF